MGEVGDQNGRSQSMMVRVMPRSTPFPNVLVDALMPLLSPMGWKMFCFLWRKTVGWNKQSDRLSLSQIQRGCGMSRNSALKAIVELKGGGIIRDEGKGLRGVRVYGPALDSILTSPVPAWFGALRKRSQSTQTPRGQNTLGTSLGGHGTSSYTGES